MILIVSSGDVRVNSKPGVMEGSVILIVLEMLGLIVSLELWRVQ